jgi:hypothetical protein
MSAKERPWTVLPHDPIEKLAPNLWSVAGTAPMPGGRRMMIGRLGDGRLLFCNAVPLEDAAMKEVEAWGKPAFLFVPNGFHRLDVGSFKRRYPELTVLAPKAAAQKVSERVAVDADVDALPADDGLRAVQLRGTKVGEAAFVASAGGQTSVLIPGDTIFNVPHVPGLGGLFLRLVGSSGGPRVTFIARRFIMSDAAALAASLRELAALPGLVRVLPCHGKVIDRDPAGVLAAVADRLEGKRKDWPA